MPRPAHGTNFAPVASGWGFHCGLSCGCRPQLKWRRAGDVWLPARRATDSAAAHHTALASGPPESTVAAVDFPSGNAKAKGSAWLKTAREMPISFMRKPDANRSSHGRGNWLCPGQHRRPKRARPDCAQRHDQSLRFRSLPEGSALGRR
jgi:hypothetical protein